MDERVSAPVLFEERITANGKHIGFATLNAGKTLNSLSLEMVRLLAAQLSVWRSDADIALVVLQAAGERAFCAGGDLRNLYRSMLAHHASDARADVLANRYAMDFFAEEYRLDYLIHCYSKPILCWGHGFVMGGGIGLMAGASHRVVTAQSRLAMPEISIGLFPDVGASWLLSRMPGRTGLFLALTAVHIGPADALFVGLADYAIPQSSKESVMHALQCEPWAGERSIDDALLSKVLEDFASPAAHPPGPLQQRGAIIDSLCDGRGIREIVSALERGGSGDPWLEKAVATLMSGAPESVMLAYGLQRHAKDMSLAEAFRMEYVAALRCAAKPNFAEGIRALLIDKDARPRWLPATRDQAADLSVTEYFIEPAWGSHPLADLRSS